MSETMIARETVSTADGDVAILIEVEETLQTDRWDTRAETDEIATEAFSQGMKLIRTCAEQVSETVAKVSNSAKPSGVEVQVGIKLSAEAGAIIAKTSGEAHLNVKLTWDNSAVPSSPNPANG